LVVTGDAERSEIIRIFEERRISVVGDDVIGYFGWFDSVFAGVAEERVHAERVAAEEHSGDFFPVTGVATFSGVASMLVEGL